MLALIRDCVVLSCFSFWTYLWLNYIKVLCTFSKSILDQLNIKWHAEYVSYLCRLYIFLPLPLCLGLMNVCSKLNFSLSGYRRQGRHKKKLQPVKGRIKHSCNKLPEILNRAIQSSQCGYKMDFSRNRCFGSLVFTWIYVVTLKTFLLHNESRAQRPLTCGQ